MYCNGHQYQLLRTHTIDKVQVHPTRCEYTLGTIRIRFPLKDFMETIWSSCYGWCSPPTWNPSRPIFLPHRFVVLAATFDHHGIQSLLHLHTSRAAKSTIHNPQIKHLASLPFPWWVLALVGVSPCGFTIVVWPLWPYRCIAIMLSVYC